jgi:hypothetical protein
MRAHAVAGICLKHRQFSAPPDMARLGKLCLNSGGFRVTTLREIAGSITLEL